MPVARRRDHRARVGDAHAAHRRRSHRQNPSCVLSLHHRAYSSTCGSQWRERAGTRGASCSGSCSPTPRSEIGALTAGGSAGTRLGVHQPHLLPLADRVLADTTAEHARRARRGLPRAAARPLRRARGAARRRRARGRLRRRPPADRPGRLDPLVRRRPRRPWPYGLPELPGAREALRGAPPDRRARAATRRRSTLALVPALAAGLVEPEVVVTAVSRHVRRRQGAQAAPARRRGDGRAVGVRRGRRAPAHPEIVQNLSVAAGRPVGVSFTPVLAPMPRGILATCTARADRRRPPRSREAYAKAYADEPFVHLLPEGSGRPPPPRSGRTPCTCRSRSIPTRRRLVAVAAIDNLTKGTAGGAVQCTTSPWACRRPPACR